MTKPAIQESFLAEVRPSLQYDRKGSTIVRTIVTSEGTTLHRLPSVIPEASAERDWHASRARGNKPEGEGTTEDFGIVDLFSGAGGLSLGIHWAIEAVGKRPKGLLAADIDAPALDVHTYNFFPKRSFNGSVRDLLKREPLVNAPVPATVSADAVRLPSWPKTVDRADIVIGGPPCQGHSNLNNRTRRTDPRNELYLWMAVAAHTTQAKLLIIENVASVELDAGDVVQRTVDLLGDLGYVVGFQGILSADRFGVGQTRKRHFLIAVRRDVMDYGGVVEAGKWLSEHQSPEVSVLDVIGDLETIEPGGEYDTPSELSDENTERVKWLIEKDAFDLPDELRPACHRDKEHTYGSVYGRMYPDRPAPTLSTGFLSPGRGRYVHPTQPRTLTLHEGARVQGFPDDFRFTGALNGEPARTQVARMIGDAVPPPLAMHVGLAALWMLRPE